MFRKDQGKGFLRGLGVGMVFTVLLFVLYQQIKNPSELSKEEIIAKAKEYGMVEAMDQKLDEMSNLQPQTPSPEPVPTSIPVTPEQTGEPLEPSKSPEVPYVSEDGYVEVVINRGDSLGRIASTLKAAGILNEEAKFKRYLVENKYVPKIRAGTYKIKQGSKYATIAKIISGK